MLIDIFQLKFIKGVNGIIHIGAHDCEERFKYLSRFNEVTDDDIIWIDALKHKVEEMQSKNSSIRIYNECIGNNDNESVIFKVTNNYQSSSFLSLKEHLIEHPDIHEIAQIEMKTKTLKTFYDQNNLKYDKYNFMALDIQGAELLALKGASEILNTVDYIYIEVNTKELYESCALLPEIDEYLFSFGFSRDNILMTEHGWGDAFYTKHIHNLINPIKITYGTDYSNIDITDISIKKCMQNNIIHIPNDDQKRNILFGDPLPGIKKYVFIVSCNITYTIDYYDYVNIDIKNNKLYINESVPISSVNEYKILKHQYNFAIMAIFKNETMVLKTWLEHYLWQGVEHFYLIDNGSTDQPLSILQKYIDEGIVTYYYRPERFCQAQHYRVVFDLENLKETCKWLCICDLDELFFGTEQILAKELDNFDNYDVINTHSFFYGSDGLINQPEDIRTAIVHRTDDIINGNKYIFKPSTVKDSSEIWIHWLVEPGTYQKKNGLISTDNDTKIRLNHYIVQSLEYFQEVKMTRGDVSVSQNENIRTMETFNYYTQAATIKDDILKRIIETNYDYTKIFVYGDSHGKFNFNNFEKILFIENTDNRIIFNDRHQSNITMFRIAREQKIINFNSNEHDKNSILCFNYGDIDCRCHIQKQINLGRNEDEIINDLVSKYFISIHKNIKEYKKIVIIAIIPSTHQNDYEKNYGPITHKHPFIGTDENRIRYTKKMNETIKKFCLKYNYHFFDPFLYYTREDGSLKHELSDNMVHLGNNEHFLKKFWIDILENKYYNSDTFYDENDNIIDHKSIENTEQQLANLYILNDDIVLELGARYGTVSCAINKKLTNKKNQVSIEPDSRVWTALEMNKIRNGCNFNIVNGFVSNKKLDLTNLETNYGTTYIENENTLIPSFSLNEIKYKYKINKFTAIVADCEGFLELFFDENPELYDDLRIIIFEADYEEKCNYNKIRNKLFELNFTKILEGHQNVWIKLDYQSIQKQEKYIKEEKKIEPEIQYETINLKYYQDGYKDEPNFSIENMNHKIYKLENITNYEYAMFNPEIKINRICNLRHTSNAQIYIILDCPGLDAFVHWVFETFIFFPLFEKINHMYPNVKILTSNKKKYVANLLKFIGMNNEIVYKIDNYDNICFIPPLLSLNYMTNAAIINNYTNQFIDRIIKTTSSFNYENNILFLPRNIKDNYFPDDRIPIHFLRERRNKEEIEYISECVIKNGGIVLNTYEINNFNTQFSIIRNSKNIILDYGSSLFVNGIFCKNKNIIVLNKDLKCKFHKEYLSYVCLFEIMISNNNNVVILEEYNSYEDIAKYFV
jgi:FkbM family methyltransferase